MMQPRARGGSRWFAAVLPGQWSAERARALASLLGRVPLEADQMLRRPTPHVVSFGDEQAAQAFQGALARAGVKGVVWDQQTLDEVPDARVPSVLTVDAVGGEDPYRGGRDRIDVWLDDGSGAEFSREEIQLVVAAKLTLERVEEKDELIDPIPATHALRPSPAPLVVRRVQRQYDDQWVIDLYGATPAPLRILERATEIRGFDSKRFERRACMLALRKWLAEPTPRLSIQEGYLPLGLHIAATPDDVRRDDAAGWDAWSATAWVIHRLGNTRSRSL